MENDVFNFSEFLNEPNSKSTKEEIPVEKIELIKENIIIEEETENIIEEIVESSEEDNYYKIYKDKPETFSCDINIEGAKLEETSARIIIESNDWTIMFNGEIENGKVNIPMRKLNILEEGATGKIKLEIIADNTVFIPWEDTFKVKLSKKVMVSFNEKKTFKKPFDPKIKVSVSKK